MILNARDINSYEDFLIKFAFNKRVKFFLKGSYYNVD